MGTLKVDIQTSRVPADTAELLDSEARRINRPEFIGSDPVQFPRMFSRLQDIEIVAFLSAIIAWGRRSMICRDAEKILSLMDHQPYAYVMDEGYEELPHHMNLHRTLFTEHMAWFLRGLRKVFKNYGSLDNFASIMKSGESETPAWHLIDSLQRLMVDVNNGETCSQCLPTNLSTTALKRVNMALRWLVRDDGIVDMGVWKSIPKSKLYIPLDVHVGNTARDLGLIFRRSNDRRTVEDLTAVLSMLRPDDPVFYDYALFGIGVGE